MIVQEPQDNEVQIDIKAAAALNFPDFLIVQGSISLNLSCLLLLAMKVQELIKKTGKNVTKFKEGDRVYFMAPYGAFAEKINISEFGVFPIPEDILFN